MNSNILISETRLDRRVALVTALVVMLLGSYFVVSLESGAQTTSPVIISIEDGKKSRTVLDDERVYIPILLDNSGDDAGEWDQTLSMRANFVNGASGFTNGFSIDDQGTALPTVTDFKGNAVDTGVFVPRDQTRVIYLWVEAPSDSNTKSARSIQVVGFDNYGFLTSGANMTRTSSGQNLVVTVKGVKEYDVSVTLDDVSQNGNNKLYQQESTVWGFKIKNEGYESDVYTLAGKAYKSGQTSAQSGWLFQFSGGNSASITGSKVIGAKTSLDTSVTITPPANAAPTTYDIEIRVTGTNISKADKATAVIPEPDFVITDLVFSHTASWTSGKGTVGSAVIATATVKNNGGNRDSQGHTTTHVDVTFSIQGAVIVSLADANDIFNADGGNSKTVYVNVLNHGDEEEVTIAFASVKDFEGLSTDLIVEVLADTLNDPADPDDVNILESNENNNDMSKTFKVVKTTGATPSFTLGFIALLAAALVLVALSMRFRRKLEE